MTFDFFILFANFFAGLLQLLTAVGGIQKSDRFLDFTVWIPLAWLTMHIYFMASAADKIVGAIQ